MAAKTREPRLIVVSNRLPFVLTEGEQGEWQVEGASGGLVTAMVPVLQNRGGVWIGWPGITAEDEAALRQALVEATADTRYTLRPVVLTAQERDKFYYGFSNEVLWPLFHDLQSRCNFDPSYWPVYQTVNRRYAEVTAEAAAGDDFIWVHDYHLLVVGQQLRALGVKSRTALFLHIPFPAFDLYVKLPWRAQLLNALLEYDLIGFQTLGDRENFIHCVRRLIGVIEVKGKGQVVTLHVGVRKVRLGAFPIGIDFDEFASRADSPEVSERARLIRQDTRKRQLILGVDRLDYTKGIPDKLKAFHTALRRFPELQRRVTLVQVVVPSREHIPEYYELKLEIERLVGRINGEFTQPGWVPIHYIHRSLNRTELISYYRAAAIGLVTPLRDGMNLVAKELCACSVDEDAVLILSEFAGAAAQLQDGALLVNPYDVEGIGDAIQRAYAMDLDERRMRMRKLRRMVRERNIVWWTDSFLRAAIEKELGDFPVVQEYIPS
ncbi:MAG: alpha,alpha-trehalose-phosphate synthase (UDP-forming) [Gemmatimonadota bacterium]